MRVTGHIWLGAVAAWLGSGCGTTTGGGGGVGAVQDAVADMSLSFGGKDTATKDLAGGGKQDAGLVDDAGEGDATGSGDDTGTAEDTATAEDSAVQDTGWLSDTPGFFDEDIVDASGDVGKDTGKDTSKDTGATTDTATDTGKDTTSKDTGSTDSTGSCGNGSCDPGESCSSCAVDCTCTPCNPLTSTGCTASQQCYVTQTGLQCGGFGKVADGGSCTYLNDCAKGSMCVGAICRKICTTVSSSLGLTCTTPAKCQELASGGTSIGYNLGACFAPDNCNLVTSSGCPSGLACMPGTDGKQCTPAGKVGLDGVCKSVADCAADYLCINNGATSGTCKKRCDTTVAGSCPSGLSCGTITIGDPPVLVGENFGVCDVP